MRMQERENTYPLNTYSLQGASTCIATLEINVVVTLRAEIDLSQDWVIPFLCVYPKDCSSHYRDTSLPMVSAVLFIKTRHWK